MPTIAHFSDIHFGREEPLAVEAMVDEMKGRTPDAVVVSGDLTQRARRPQFAAAAKFIARLPEPRLLVPGNHDIPLYNFVARFLWPLRNFREVAGATPLPIVERNDLWIIGVNSARPLRPRPRGFWKDGNLSKRQLIAMCVAAQRREEIPNKVMVTHHPLAPCTDHHRGDITGGAADAIRSCQSCGIQLILGGHLHIPFATNAAEYHRLPGPPVYYVQAGTSTSNRRRGFNNSYNWITITPQSITVEARHWVGDRMETLWTRSLPRI